MKTLLLVFYYIYFVLIAAPILVTATIVAVIFTVLGTFVTDGKFWGYYPSAIWGWLFCVLSLVRVEVRGRENIDKKTSYLFVANHQGAYDIFSVYGFLHHNFRWMMKQSLRRNVFVGYACYRSRHIFVDRSSASAVKKTIAAAASQLSNGMSLVIFPEGERTFTGKVGRFKKGAYNLALEFKLPMVPITIDGSFDVMPRTAWKPRPGHIILTIHKPIMPPTDESERAAVMEQTREAIVSALPPQLRD